MYEIGVKPTRLSWYNAEAMIYRCPICADRIHTGDTLPPRLYRCAICRVDLIVRHGQLHAVTSPQAGPTLTAYRNPAQDTAT